MAICCNWLPISSELPCWHAWYAWQEGWQKDSPAPKSMPRLGRSYCKVPRPHPRIWCNVLRNYTICNTCEMYGLLGLGSERCIYLMASFVQRFWSCAFLTLIFFPCLSNLYSSLGTNTPPNVNLLSTTIIP